MKELLVLEKSQQARELLNVDAEWCCDLSDRARSIDRTESGKEVGSNIIRIEGEEAQMSSYLDSCFDTTHPDAFSHAGFTDSENLYPFRGVREGLGREGAWRQSWDSPGVFDP